MKIRHYDIGEVLVIEPAGDIRLGPSDIQLRDYVKERIAEGRRKLVIDLSQVGFIDSAGIGDLVAARSSAISGGGNLKLTGLNARLTDMFMLTKLLLIFQAYDSLDEAVLSY